MSDSRKSKLEKLLKQNKIKQAEKQLVDDLLKYHAIDISDKVFVDFEVSEDVHKKVYKLIKTDKIDLIKFPYDEETLKLKIDFLFDYYKIYENENILFYPSTFGFYFRSSNQLYLDYPLAITLPLKECKRFVQKLMLEMHDDLVLVSVNFNFGFVLSEDEYSDVTIEYWGPDLHNKNA